MILLVILYSFAYLTTPTILITRPIVTPFQDNSIPYFYSNFGQVPYGKTLSFDLNVLNSSLCIADNSTRLSKPTYLAVQVTPVDMCSVTRMALNAQAMGAKGLIVGSVLANNPSHDVIACDDGNGKKVHITSLHITQYTFKQLKGLGTVQISANFPVPKKKISKVSLLISAAQRQTYIFLRSFEQDFIQMQPYLSFQVIYHTVQCSYCDSSYCMLGDYCAFDFESYQPGVGSKIIQQQLNQYSILTRWGTRMWLRYMNLFDQYCDGSWHNIEGCVSIIKRKLGIQGSYPVNPMDTLKLWRMRQTKLGFDGHPQVAINHMIYRGNFQKEEVLDAICASLQNPPSYCSPNQQKPVEESNNHHVVIIVLMSLLGLVVIGGIGICLYRKFVRGQLTKDMSSRIGELVATYANKVSAIRKKQRDRFIESQEEEL